jgi:hypothetical protein
MKVRGLHSYSLLGGEVVVSLFAFFCLAASSEGAEIRIAWDPNTEEDLAGYRVYYGTASKTYGQPITIGKETTYAITGLIPGQRYCIAVTAFDTAGNESDFSNEVCGLAPDSLLGRWEVEISGRDTGGAVLWFEEHTMNVGGYGLSAAMELFGFKGKYTLEPDGEVEGTLIPYDLKKGEDLPIGLLSIKGMMKPEGVKIKLWAYSPGGQSLFLKIRGWASLKGVVAPEGWVATLRGLTKGRVKNLHIEPFELNGRVYDKLFRMTGEGFWESGGPFLIEGLFLLNSRNKTFGMWEGMGLKSIRGTLRGKFDPSAETLKFRIKGEEGNIYVLTGHALTP